MSKVWRKLNRVGKKASKYRFTTYSHILNINCSPKWHPDKVCITWTRSNRKIQSKLSQWEPSLQNSFEGIVYWEKATDFLEFDVSLYRGINDDRFEVKEWSIFVECEESNGKRRLLATGKLNMNEYTSIDPFFQTDIKLKLKTLSTKINSATISFSLKSQFLKEGKATDDDMISIASYMSTASTNNPYLNSNVIFNPNRNTRIDNDQIKDFDEADFDLDNETDIMTNNTDNDQDDIEFYMKLQTEYSSNSFNDISKNFGKQVQQVTKDFQVDFLTAFDKVLETNKPEELTSIDETFKKNTSNKSSPEKRKPIISNDLVTNKRDQKLKPIAPIADHIDNTSNPFAESSAESTNPFEETQGSRKITENETNPFLSPTLTNSSVSDLSNPFLNSERDTNVSEKKRSSVKIINSSKKPIAPCAANNMKKGLTLPNLDLSGTSKDLLYWCKDIVKTYKATAYLPANKVFEDLIIDDFTYSWKSGLAFCAIFYHFKPNLIDLNCLSKTDANQNLKIAFKASDKLQIGRVVELNDFIKKGKLDQLLIMTYIFQLRDHFETQPNKSKLQSPIISQSNSFSSPLNAKTKDKKQIKNTSTPIKKNTAKPTENAKLKTSSYYNPFDSDPNEADETERKENITNSTSNCLLQIDKNGQIEDVSSVGANASQMVKIEFEPVLLDLPNCKNTSPKLVESANTEELSQRVNELLERTDHNNSQQKMENINEKVKSIIKKRRKSSMAKSSSLHQSLDNKTEGNKSMMNTSSSILGTEYVNQEILNFKNEQRELDEHAVFLENKLRSLINESKTEKKSDKEKDLEDRLLREWFLLVNRKNALLIRQQEVEIIQNEKNLEKRYNLLSDKLRELIEIDEFYKTEEQKTAESILLNELISNVMERNDLVLQMDEENKLLNEGEIINEYIQNKSSFQHDDKSCSIQ